MVDVNYRLLRQALNTRKTFFNDIKTLTRYLYFESWQHLLDFMIKQLELDPQIWYKLVKIKIAAVAAAETIDKISDALCVVPWPGVV